MAAPTTYHLLYHDLELLEVGDGHDCGGAMLLLPVPWVLHGGRGVCHWGCGYGAASHLTIILKISL